MTAEAATAAMAAQPAPRAIIVVVTAPDVAFAPAGAVLVDVSSVTLSGTSCSHTSNTIEAVATI